MNGRTFVLILFFWAVLTILTPILVRLSASAKLSSELINGEDREGTKEKLALGLLSRRALVAAALKRVPAPPFGLAPAPAPEPVVDSKFRLKMMKQLPVR